MGAEHELYALAYAAIRFLAGGQVAIGRGVTWAVCADQNTALVVALQAAKQGLPETEGWLYHDVVVSPIPRMATGGGRRVTITIEEVDDAPRREG